MLRVIFNHLKTAEQRLARFAPRRGGLGALSAALTAPWPGPALCPRSRSAGWLRSSLCLLPRDCGAFLPPVVPVFYSSLLGDC